MNTEIRETLNISEEVVWKYINDDIYNSLHDDLIKPVTNTGKTSKLLLASN